MYIPLSEYIYIYACILLQSCYCCWHAYCYCNLNTCCNPTVRQSPVNIIDLRLLSVARPLRLCKSFSHCMAPAQLLPNPLPCGAFCMNPTNNKPYACISPCFFPELLHKARAGMHDHSFT